MAVTYAGQGDPRRTMELLWDVSTTSTDPATSAPRGPKPALTVEAIVSAATDIADTHGFDAVSMRAVGERLGRTAMALYTYVPSKAELFDLMLDRALAELDVAYDLTDGWRPAAIFAAADLTGVDALKVVGLVSAYVVGLTRQVSELRAATRTLGQSEDDWWQAQSALMAELVPDVDARYPHLAVAGQEGAFEIDAEPDRYLETEARQGFEFGLERLLDGVEVYLHRSQRPS